MAHKPLRWTYAAEDDLLASLDFIVQKHQFEYHCMPTEGKVLLYLKAVALNPSVTQRGIKKALLKIFVELNPGPSDPSYLPKFITHGTSTLLALDDDRRNKISHIVAVLKASDDEDNKSSPRKTRSGTRTDLAASGLPKGATSNSKRRLWGETTRKGVSKGGTKKVKSETVLRPQSSILRHPTVVVESRRRGIATPLSSSGVSCSDSSAHVPEMTSSERRPAHDSTSKASKFANDGHTTSDLLQQPFILAAERDRTTPIFDYAGRVSDVPFDEASTTRSKDEMIIGLFNDNWRLRTELDRSKAAHSNLVDDIRLRKLVQSRPLPDAMDEIGRANSAYKRTLNECGIVREILEKQRECRIIPNGLKIEESYEELWINILNLTAGEEIMYDLATIGDAGSQDLQALKTRVLFGSSRPLQYGELRLPLDIWVQSLLGAAVCEWVFAETYKGIAVLYPPIVHGFMRAIDLLYSEDQLNKIESVAYQFLVTEKNFKDDFLRRSADVLARRFLTSLALIIEDEELLTRYDPDGEIAGIFLCALGIKILGSTPKYKFDFIWPARDANIDIETMIGCGLYDSTIAQDPSDQEGGKVLLTLVPGILVHEVKRKYNAYTGRESGTDEECGFRSLKIRARVVDTEKV